MMKKRTELGLADPLVTDRLRLWALGSGLATLLTVISTGAMLAGVNFAVWAPGMLTVGVLGVTTAAFIRLAFLPPTAYKRRVLRRAATA
jgi:hypothetical protein